MRHAPYPHPTPSQLRQRAQERQMRKLLTEEFGNNHVDVHVLQARELAEVWVSLQKEAGREEEEIAENFRKITGIALDLVREQTGNAQSSLVLAKLGAEMHRSGKIFGTYRVVQIDALKLIVLEGKYELRKHLTIGTYAAGSPKIVQMGIGKAGANAMLRSGVVLTLILSPVIRTIEWLFIDKEATLTSVLARVSTDIVKGIIAAGAGYFAGITVAASWAVATGTVVAVGPAAAGILVAIGVGLMLSKIDNRFGLTDKLIDSLVGHHEQWQQQMAELKNESRRQFRTDNITNFFLKLGGGRYPDFR